MTDNTKPQYVIVSETALAVAAHIVEKLGSSSEQRTAELRRDAAKLIAKHLEVCSNDRAADITSFTPRT